MAEAGARGASLVGLRQLNATAVLETIRTRHPISRAQLARDIGLTRPTVSSALETLLEAQLVRETPPPSGSLSYGANFFEPAPDATFFVAFDIDRRQQRALLADAAGEVLAAQDGTDPASTAHEIVESAVRLAQQLCTEAGIDRSRLAVAMVGVPGAVDPGNGRIRLSSYRLLEGCPLGSVMAEALAIPTYVHNDVNLAAIGELDCGAARRVKDFAYLTIGKGVGAGLVINGNLVPGFHGAAGEIDNPGKDRRYLPDSPAADGFADFARRRLAELPHPSSLRPTPISVFSAARAGYPVALEILAEEADRIAERAAQLCRVVDVELVVLGGGIGRRCDLILDQIRASLARRLPFPPRVEISQLDERPVFAGAIALGTQAALARVTPHRLSQVLGSKSA